MDSKAGFFSWLNWRCPAPLVWGHQVFLMLGIVGQSTWIVSNKYKHSFKRERALPRSFMWCSLNHKQIGGLSWIIPQCLGILTVGRTGTAVTRNICIYLATTSDSHMTTMFKSCLLYWQLGEMQWTVNCSSEIFYVFGWMPLQLGSWIPSKVVHVQETDQISVQQTCRHHTWWWNFRVSK